METAFRYGVARGWDAEVIVSPYNRVDAANAVASGVGDVTLRLRKTIAGVDGVGSSLGVIGYVTLPTGAEGLGAEDVEGGALAAGGMALSDDWELAWTVGLGAVSDGNLYDISPSGGMAFSHRLTDRFGMYVEGIAERLSGETAAAVNFGATFLSSETTQFDGSVGFGIAGAADDLRFSIGWARLF